MKTIDTREMRERGETRPTAIAGAPEQEFDAPQAVLDLVVEVMTALGAAPDVAREAARTGRIALGTQRLVLLLAPDESALIVGALLDENWAGSREQRARLLKANTYWLLTAGISFAIGLGGPQLLCRWNLEPRMPDALAQWLRNFAAFAADLQAVRA
ncbi:type III secretion system chaperone [Trinickia sp.]|uniref:type III secretion system chaperone n=1 Tax=Trinickia sp. TaxID=2571163 RepID=UPI003F811E20